MCDGCGRVLLKGKDGSEWVTNVDWRWGWDGHQDFDSFQHSCIVKFPCKRGDRDVVDRGVDDVILPLVGSPDARVWYRIACKCVLFKMMINE